MKKFNFEFHVDELLLIGEYVKTCYSRDHQDFIRFSPEFWEPHLFKFTDKLREISIVIQRNQTTRQLNEIATRIEMISPIITEYLTQLSVIFNFVNLKILIRKTKPIFQNLHHYIKEVDSEKLVFFFTQLKQSVYPYIKQLEDAAFDHGLQAELDAYISILNAEYVEKKTLMAELTYWEERNALLFNEFWSMLDQVLRSGQKIYCKNPVKLNDYTSSYVLMKVRETVSR